MGTTSFCPFCGRQSPDDDQTCARCGMSLDHWREYPFEERLLLTLRHPLPEHQMMAIRLLGKRKYERAVPVIAEMIAAGQDVYVLRDIAVALSQIDTADNRKLLERLRDHPSPVVRRAGKEPGRQTPEGGAR